MIVKPKPAPADPTKVCKTCGHYDPILQICCARDMLIMKEDAEQWTCGDWEEKLNVFTVTETIGMDPANPVKVPLQPDDAIKFKASETIGCRIVNRDGITWATLRIRCCGNCLHQAGDEMCPDPGEPSNEGCKNWEPKKDHEEPSQVVDKSCDNCGKCHPIIAMCTEHPDRSIWPPKENVCDEWVEMPAKLQPDDSLKMKASETIGAHIVNPDGVTKLTFGGTSLNELAAKRKKQEEQLPPGACCFNCEHRDKMSLKCKLNISDAVLTVMRSQHECCGSWEREQDHGVTLRVVDPEEDKKQKEAQVQERLIAKEKGWRRGYMMAELHLMCDAASQLLPDRKPQWECLRDILEDALRALWARNDQDKRESKA